MRPLICVAAAVLGIASAASAGNTALGCNAQAPGGRNLVFADYVKTSTFGQPNITGSQNVTVDARGWPTQDFSLLFLDEEYIFPAADLSGVYTITALGCASVSVPLGFGGLSIVNQSCPSGNLLAFLEISSNGTLVNGKGALAFTGTSRGAGLGAGLRNVSLLLPGYPAGTDPDTLHEPFLANMRGRCAVTRFLGWAMYGHTNYSSHDTPPTPADWSIRPRLGDATYFLGGWGTRGLGVPFEMIARIANAIGSDVWLNVPSSKNETARDEYVVNLLVLFDGLLPAGRRIYLEYANECFFGNNECYPDDVAIATDTIMNAGDPYKLNLGLPSPPNASNAEVWGYRMYAYTCLHFAALARSVVGAARVGRADTPGVRVVPLIGALQSYATDGDNKLAWLVAAWGPPTAAGLATMNIGSYYGAAENVTKNPNVSVDEVMTSMLASVAASDPAALTAYSGRTAISGFAAVSAYYGLALHAYEGGPSTGTLRSPQGARTRSRLFQCTSCLADPTHSSPWTLTGAPRCSHPASSRPLRPPPQRAASVARSASCLSRSRAKTRACKRSSKTSCTRGSPGRAAPSTISRSASTRSCSLGAHMRTAGT